MAFVETECAVSDLISLTVAKHLMHVFKHCYDK